MITRNLKMEVLLGVIVFVCKVACSSLSPESREQSLQNYDKTRSLLGRGLEMLTAHSLHFSLLSKCDQVSPELGHFRLTEK